MSADLFAAFGTPVEQGTNDARPELTTPRESQEQHQHQHQQQNPWILQSRPIPDSVRQGPLPAKSLWKKVDDGPEVLFDASDNDDEDDDDFGAFEQASNQEGQSTVTLSQLSRMDDADLLGLDSLNVGTYTATHTNEPQIKQPTHNTNNLLEIETIPQHQFDQHKAGQVIGVTRYDGHPTLKPTSQQTQSPVPNSTQDDEDEWGNFENVENDQIQTSEPVTTRSPATENQAFDQEWNILDDEPPKQVSFGEPVEQKYRAATETTTKTATPKINGPNHQSGPAKSNNVDDEDEDEWDAFEDGPPLQPHPTFSSSQTITKLTSGPKPSNPTQPSSIQHQERPTNIPPPSILFQLLPQIYQILRTQSQQTTKATITAKTSQEDPDTSTTVHDLAHQIRKVYTVTARILSGRTHRWKRDTILSQSTRISAAGPSSSSSGMKLTSLDKGQTIKEDREAAEVVAAWRRHAAGLNAVMVRAKVAKPPASLSEKGMSVRAASGAGVLSARECCAVCGLKRNERVLGIDVNVDDIFGEFWVEFWGHRDCCDFWNTYEGLLERR